MTTQPPHPDKWTKFLMDIYMQAQPPILGTVNIKEIEEKAREVMKDHMRTFRDYPLTPSMTDQSHRLFWTASYMYTFGSAGTCMTDEANKKALENWKIVPRMLVDTANRSLEARFRSLRYLPHTYE